MSKRQAVTICVVTTIFAVAVGFAFGRRMCPDNILAVALKTD